ncbi:hypothetical protein BDF20DRAFT_816184 [Mycotypha africana]|uniref:uncharacterized protein n=1 Tax=Mycotypha africana TaxID=64632 RepID=UPI0023005AE7|nr:uncharacterized protein BDF20DRAFT_816184 [Mycotypha africana]KAI8984149.1 hypothetical protein BDF20DRAFT_816184 [Mycotypha africana]
MSRKAPSAASFRCPAPDCNSSTHLFGPELHLDITVSELIKLHQEFFSNAPLLPLSPISEASSYSGSFSEQQKNITDFLSSDALLRKLSTILTCQLCHSMVSSEEPITTPCGHTFCKLCILHTKTIENRPCSLCNRPLPKYSSLSAQKPNRLIATFVKDLTSFLSSFQYARSESNFLDSLDLHQTNVPLYVSNAVILPQQRCQLQILNEEQYNMLRKCLIPSTRYNSLCLASVHRSHPNVAQFGTLLSIMNVEHRRDAIFLDVVGVDRFQLETHNFQKDREGITTIYGTFDILHEATLRQISFELPNAPPPDDHKALLLQRDRISTYAIHLADSVLEFIHHIAGSSETFTLPKLNVLHAQTEGLFGPQWLAKMQTQFGPMPSKLDPIAVAWWAALVLLSSIYGLLRSITIIERLELIISWMQNIQAQWIQCRNTAIHAFSQVPDSK